MKIKLLLAIGGKPYGETVDGITNQSKNMAVFFDDYGNYCVLYSGQFEVVGTSASNGGEVPSLRQLLGQDVRMIEFK